MPSSNVRLTRRQALVDAPTIRGEGGLPRAPRHAASLQDTKLTSIVMDKLPRGIGTGKLAKKWEAQGIEEKWKATSWYKKSQAMEKRRNMTDFDRFVAMKLKKQVSASVYGGGLYGQGGRSHLHEELS